MALDKGVAVLVPNVRGSDGYGKSYLLLDNGLKREDSVKDIGALLDWIAEQRDLDENRVAIYGASYGGYLVLASAVHYSDRLRAGVDVVGISNFVSFLENTEDYRRAFRRYEYGDERDPETRAFLERISPLNNVDRIDIPLLVVQGRNVARVPASESVQIVRALRDRNQPVWYIEALNEGRIDVIATDHAPHTADEKRGSYFKAPAGLPLVQHALLTLFDLAANGQISLELAVDRACHAPADLFGVVERGYVREGWFADLVIVDPAKPYFVAPANVLYRCGWSPFEGHEFSATIDTTIINGRVVWRDGRLTGAIPGQRLQFTRER